MPYTTKNLIAAFIFFWGLSSIQFANAEERLRLATTTSTQNSGLLDVLNPAFEEEYNIKVDVIAVGTGKALRLGENGDVDVVFVHAPGAEMKFVEAGYGIERNAVMHNDFVILGPHADPAKLRTAKTLPDAMKKISHTKSTFVSRGDDSGTHKKETKLWEIADIQPKGNWYLSVGQGMGAVLQITNDKLAYTLTDRGTYLAYMGKVELEVVFEKDEILFNPYHIILVNPKRHPHVKLEAARSYSNFIRGEEGQTLIYDFRVNGKALFHPDVITRSGLKNTE